MSGCPSRLRQRVTTTVPMCTNENDEPVLLCQDAENVCFQTHPLLLVASFMLLPTVNARSSNVACAVCRWFSVRSAGESWRSSSEPRLSVRKRVNKTSQRSLSKAPLHGEVFPKRVVNFGRLDSGSWCMHSTAAACCSLLNPISVRTTRNRRNCCRYSNVK